MSTFLQVCCGIVLIALSVLLLAMAASLVYSVVDTIIMGRTYRDTPFKPFWWNDDEG